jgi:hypothetical protein
MPLPTQTASQTRPNALGDVRLSRVVEHAVIEEVMSVLRFSWYL